MMVMALAALQRRGHFVEADRAVAVLVELGKHIVGLREVGAAGAERAFKFVLGDLAVAVAVDLREQVLQRVRSALAAGCRRARRLALRIEQRAHGLRRYLRAAAARSRVRAGRGRGRRGQEVERAFGILGDAGGLRRRGFRRRQRLQRINGSGCRTKSKKHWELQQRRIMRPIARADTSARANI